MAKHCFPLFPADVALSPGLQCEGWFNVYRDMHGDHYRGSEYHKSRDVARDTALAPGQIAPRPPVIYRIHVIPKT